MDWSSAVLAGLAAGVGMAVWSLLLYMLRVTNLLMPRYTGCMLTRTPLGPLTFVVGLALHLMLSVLIAFLYAWVFEAVWEEATLLYGLLLGVVHWAIAGLMIPLMDRLNGCVQRGDIPAAGWFMAGYGPGAAITLLSGHLLYGMAVGLLYHVPGT